MIERSVQIDAPVEKVYGCVRDFKSWTEWSPWLVTERDARLDFSEDGRSYAWDGKVLGSGEMHLEGEQENQSLTYRLVMLTPWKSQSDVRFNFSSVDGGTRVTWRMDGALPFFMFFMKTMMESFIGMDYDRGLGMLKEFAETGSVVSELKYYPDSEYPGCKYVGIKRTCPVGEIGDYMAKDFKTLGAWAEAQSVTVSDKPFSVYSKWDCKQGSTEYTAGFPVAEMPSNLPEGAVSGELPSCRAFVIEHQGPYRHVGNAWSAGMCRARAKLFKQSKRVFPFEVYVSDATSVPEKELVTRVYFPLR
ncbi:MAG: SRPBCC family protein [Opitutaceae bacterium]